MDEVESTGRLAAAPPWPLTRAEIDAFGGAGLAPVRVEEIQEQSGVRRWRAEFHSGPIR
ncbi:hypothetical protein [Micromonospora coriariae]|uniref:hypothetical protein n=1 Tax=Micromonospora coriariae TaxID=285665 RepID=UPI0012FE1677|nr:hypothetical protein [Micromonospora coriariae]